LAAIPDFSPMTYSPFAVSSAKLFDTMLLGDLAKIMDKLGRGAAKFFNPKNPKGNAFALNFIHS
jgi:hypothetical protein